MFEIGDKVVCIGSLPPNLCPESYQFRLEGRYLSDPIKTNSVYVIRKVITFPHWHKSVIGLSLVGYTCFDRLNGAELGYDSRMFRKLEEIQAENRAKRNNSIPNESTQT